VTKTGRNDPCWCGSGKKYKKCHYQREREQPLPLGAIEDSLNRASVPRLCMHPQAERGVCDKLISAHTIQRSRVLGRLIASDQHLLTFNVRYGSVKNPGPFRIGWRDASTIPGFCGRHDRETFRPLEAEEFVVSPRQCFLLGYRALCHELYSKKKTAASYDRTREIIDRGRPPSEQEHLQEVLRLHNFGVTTAIEDLTPVKQVMDQALLADNYDVCEIAAIEFSGPLSLATTGTFTPDFDLEGRQLQDLSDTGRAIEWLSVSVDATSDGGAVVFCWLKGTQHPRSFVESFLGQGEHQILNLLPQLLFFYLENTYFSPTWWSQLPAGEQEHLRSLAAEPNPYYSERLFKASSCVPWRLKAVHRFGPT